MSGNGTTGLEGSIQWEASILLPEELLSNTKSFRPTLHNRAGTATLWGAIALQDGFIDLTQDPLVMIRDLVLQGPGFVFRPTSVISDPQDGFKMSGEIESRFTDPRTFPPQKMIVPVPLGLNSQNKLVCTTHQGGEILKPFAGFQRLLFRPVLDYSALLLLVSEARQMNEACPPDPETEINLPYPLSLNAQVKAALHFYLDDAVDLVGGVNGQKVHDAIRLVPDAGAETSIQTRIELDNTSARLNAGIQSDIVLNLKSVEVAGQKPLKNLRGSVSGQANLKGTGLSAIPKKQPKEFPVPVQIGVDANYEVTDLEVDLSVPGGALSLAIPKAAIAVGTNQALSISGPLNNPILDGALYFSATIPQDQPARIRLPQIESDLLVSGDLRLNDTSNANGPTREITLSRVAVPVNVEVNDQIRLRSDQPALTAVRIQLDRKGLGFGKEGSVFIESNLKGPRLEIEGREAVELTGKLLLEMRVVNLSDDPMSPNFRIVAGSVKGSFNGHAIDPQSRAEVFTGELTIADDLESRSLKIKGKEAFAFGGFENYPELNALAQKVFHQILSPTILADQDLTVTLPASAIGETEGKRYYKNPGEYAGLAQFKGLLSVIQKQIGKTVAHVDGEAQVHADRAPELKSVKGDIQLPPQTIQVDSDTRVLARGGGLHFTGNATQIRASIALPNITVTRKLPNGDTLTILYRPKPFSLSKKLEALLALTGLDRDIPVSELLELGFDLEASLKDGKGASKGKVQLNASVPLRLRGTIRPGDHTASLAAIIGELKFSGSADEAIRSDLGIPLAMGASPELIRAALVGLQLNADLDLSDPDFPKARVEAVMPNFEVLNRISSLSGPKDLPPGAVELTAAGASKTPQSFVMNWDPSGESVEMLNPNRYAVKADVQAGNGKIGVGVQAEWVVGALQFNRERETGYLKASVSDLDFKLSLSGAADLEGSKLSLDRVSALGAAGQMEFAYNPDTGEVSLQLNTPPVPARSLPPSGIREWLQWGRENNGANWTRYRQAMAAHTHFIRISEEAAGLPGLPIPGGKGEIYVNPGKTHYKVKLTETGGSFPGALESLLKQFAGDLDIRRAYPNIPQVSKPVKESIIYDPAEAALFLIDPTDSKVQDLLAKALDLSSEDARLMVANGRIDLKRITEAPGLSRLSADALMGLARVFFTANQDAVSFGPAGHQFLSVLADLRINFERLTRLSPAPWDEKTGVWNSVFRKFEDEAGLAMNGYAHLNFAPDRIALQLQKREALLNWVPDLGSIASFNATQEGPVHFIMVAGGDDPIQSYSKFIVIPDAKGGSFIVWQHALKADAADLQEHLSGQDEDLSEAGLRRFLPVLDLSEISARMGRISSPNDDLYDVLRFRLNRGFSNLAYTLKNGATDFRDKRKDVYSLNFAPQEIMASRTAQEYLSYDSAQKMVSFPAKLSSTDRVALKNLLADTLSLSEADAAAMIEKGSFSIKDTIGAMPVFTQLFDLETLESLADFMLVEREGVNDRFKGRGERFLYFLKDIRERHSALMAQDPVMDLRAFDGDRFHVYGASNTTEPSDGSDSLSMAFFPKVPPAALARIVGTPEKFGEYDGADVRNTSHEGDDPKRPGRKLVNQGLFVGQELRYRISVLKDVLKIGTVSVAPWTREVDPKMEKQGFYENEGMWVVVPLKTGGSMILRYGLLNTIIPKERQLAQKAFSSIPPFLAKLALAAVGRDASKVATPSFGRLSLTP